MSHLPIRHRRAVVVVVVVKVKQAEIDDDVGNENVESARRRSVVKVVVAVDGRRMNTSIENGAGETIHHQMTMTITRQVARDDITSASGDITMISTAIEIIEVVRRMNEMAVMMGRRGNENTEIIDIIVVVITIGKMHGNKATIFGRVQVCT